jgi:hypothetical protein
MARVVDGILALDPTAAAADDAARMIQHSISKWMTDRMGWMPSPRMIMHPRQLRNEVRLTPQGLGRSRSELDTNAPRYSARVCGQIGWKQQWRPRFPRPPSPCYCSCWRAAGYSVLYSYWVPAWAHGDSRGSAKVNPASPAATPFL